VYESRLWSTIVAMRQRRTKTRKVTSINPSRVSRHESRQTAILSEIRDTLTRAYPKAEHPWYEKGLKLLQNLLKYVGIPSAILASILPVSSFVSSYVESQNSDFIESKYLEYAQGLANEGLLDRAKMAMAFLENQNELSPKTQYFNARLVAEEAVRKGVNLDTAVDSLSVLISLNKGSPLFFPQSATDEELVGLYMSLVDVELENGRHDTVQARLYDLRKHVSENSLKAFDNEILLREAHLAVLEHRYDKAKETLDTVGRSANNPAIVAAHLAFLYGKLFMFQHRYDEAERETEHAIIAYRELGDQYNLLRAYNNLGFTLHSATRYEDAAKYYEVSLNIATRLESQRAISRANLNLAIIEKVRGNVDRSKELSLLAKSQFDSGGNQLGIIGASNNLISIYVGEGDIGAALEQAYDGFEASLQVSDVRAIASLAGHIGDLKRQIEVDDDTVFFNLLSLVMYRHAGNPRKVAVVESILKRLQADMGDSKFSSAINDAKLRIEHKLDEIERSDIVLDLTLP